MSLQRRITAAVTSAAKRSPPRKPQCVQALQKAHMAHGPSYTLPTMEKGCHSETVTQLREKGPCLLAEAFIPQSTSSCHVPAVYRVPPWAPEPDASGLMEPVC